jgi:glycosyltransferase involved in cell wall biosynthesis
MEPPLISCLCITRNSINLLQRAINCFKAQTYPVREMVIIYESDDLHIKNYLETVSDDNIFYYEVPSSPKLPLGTLRNISVEKCSGTYFCQWDDDDWYAANRLEAQYEAIVKNCKAASMLSYWLMFDSHTHSAYLSSFRLWEGSILCLKSVIDDEVKYASLEKSEDTAVLKQLIQGNYIFPVIKPNLYIYVFHGNNTWNYDHFNIFYRKSLRLSPAASDLIGDILEEKYSVEHATLLLNESEFLKEIVYRYNFLDNYSLQLC